MSPFAIHRRTALAALIGSAPLRADSVDDLVRYEMQRQNIVGLALGLIRDGRPAKLQGYGLANLELNVPVNAQTVFKIASVSKHLMASAVLLLQDEGRLRLDDPVTKFVDSAPRSWNAITVRHVLSHTSGIPRESPAFDPRREQPDLDVLKGVFPLPLLHPPGEKWVYSNAGYFAVGEILRVASGKPWTELLQERLFRPLDMTGTRPTTYKEIVPNRASGYLANREAIVNADHYVAVRPSGAFLSTVADLAKWDAALYTNRPLKRALREELIQPVKLNSGQTYPYGLGLRLSNHSGHRVAEHSGNLPGFTSFFSRYLDDRFTVILLCNAHNARLEPLVRAIAATSIPGFTSR
jgi:CubicO group peptidase (beta-lactamase class C family)